MQIFTFGTVYNGSLHVPAKLPFDWLNVAEILRIFDIWSPPAILNLRNMQISTFRMVYSQSLPISTKFRHNWLNSCGDIAIF